jgi:hypothetical protein
MIVAGEETTVICVKESEKELDESLLTHRDILM